MAGEKENGFAVTPSGASADGGTRTHDPQIKSLLRFQLRHVSMI